MIDITVLIPTYNNSETLCKTLDSFLAADFSDLLVEIVVIDNNSTDDTHKTVLTFTNRLPLTYIFEPKQGKNCALNRALKETSLGEIVFFTDDDVVLERNLFVNIRNSVRQWSNYSVFGGKIQLVWPNVNIPFWAQELARQGKAFSKLDLGDNPKEFAEKQKPLGTNIWIRKEIFDQGYRFDENIGPRPTNRIMGSETSFLNLLRKNGYKIFYDPSVIIGHRVEKKLFLEKNILKRAFSAGRGGARLKFLNEERLYDRFFLVWFLYRVIAVLKWSCFYLYSFVLLPKKMRIVKRWKPVQGLGWNYELLRIAFSKYKQYFSYQRTKTEN